MRPYEGREFSFQIAAGRRGFRLIRGPLQNSDNRRYALRPLQDATLVIGELPNGEIGLVKASMGRNRKASWLTLDGIERLLDEWSASLDTLRRACKRANRQAATNRTVCNGDASDESALDPQRLSSSGRCLRIYPKSLSNSASGVP